MNKITSLVESYLSYKQNLGFQLRSEAVCLRAFARYTEELGYAGTLTRKIVFQWCERDNPSPLTKGRRFEPITGLARYVNAFDPKSETMPKLPYGNPHKRVAPHIYTLDETLSLMDKCKSLYSPDGIRALTMQTVIGLLWATGLRTSELVKLTTDDVNLDDNFIMVRKSKFNKDRIIPIAEDVSSRLRYYRTRVSCISDKANRRAEFFLSTGGSPTNLRALEYAFQKIRDEVDVSDSGYAHARLYDFRHTFATRTIKRWYEQGEDVNSKLYLLATYMGHAHPDETYWYLSSTPELMRLASSKYESMYGGDDDER